MSLLTKAVSRLRRGLKALALRFVGGTDWGWGWSLGRSRFDYASHVGDGHGNAAVMACVLWVCRTFPEAPLQVVRLTSQGEEQPEPSHPLVRLLERPNPYYSGPLLWMATLADWLTTGNAYWLKVRAGAGNVLQLWYVPQQLIMPRWPDDGSEYLTHYDYTPGGRPIRVEVADVVHFRYGLNSTNTRLGLSPLASLLREVFTDDEAASYSATILRNLGVPGVIISPDASDGQIDQATADAMKATWEQRFNGDNRGRPLVAPSKLKVEVIGYSPEQLNLRDLRRIPEERVSAVLGVPAIVAGLGAGLDRSTYANMAEAREAAYESCLIPLQRLLAAELSTQLLLDFDERDTVRITFDLAKVRVLQADQLELFNRAAVGVRAGFMTVYDAKTLCGLKADEVDRYYLRPKTTTAVPESEPFPEPEPTPPALPNEEPLKALASPNGHREA